MLRAQEHCSVRFFHSVSTVTVNADYDVTSLSTHFIGRRQNRLLWFIHRFLCTPSQYECLSFWSTIWPNISLNETTETLQDDDYDQQQRARWISRCREWTGPESGLVGKNDRARLRWHTMEHQHGGRWSNISNTCISHWHVCLPTWCIEGTKCISNSLNSISNHHETWQYLLYFYFHLCRLNSPGRTS